MQQSVKVLKSSSCVILAGGKCSRLGQAKYFIKISEKTIIERILAVVKEIFREIIIVTNNKKLFTGYPEIKIVEDLVRDSGPLAGIYTGLCAIKNRQGFFVAADMPFLNAKSINKLLTLAEKQEYDCIVPRTQAGLEVLHAIYAKSMLPLIIKHLQQKKLAVQDLLKHCNCCLADTDPSSEICFTNINTREDLARIRD